MPLTTDSGTGDDAKDPGGGTPARSKRPREASAGSGSDGKRQSQKAIRSDPPPDPTNRRDQRIPQRSLSPSHSNSHSNSQSQSQSQSQLQRQRQRPSGNSKTTLGSLLKYMEGYEVIVELKTGTRHKGRLVAADDNMNLMLEEEQEQENEDKDEEDHGGGGEFLQPPPRQSCAAQCNNNNETNNNETNKNNSNKNNKNHNILLPKLVRNLRGSSVRYVHFPDNADLMSLVRSGRERERNASLRYQKTRRKSNSNSTGGGGLGT